MAGRIWQAMLAAGPVAFWAMLGGGIVATLLFSALVLIVWLGGWPPALAGRQLEYLGWALLAQAAILALVMVRLTGASLSGKMGRAEVSINADGGAADLDKPEGRT
jgi:hypothetical protein